MSDPRAVDPTARDIAEKLAPAYRTMLDAIAQVEPRIAEATRAELTDQRHSLKLIASENYASLPVLATMGTWFSDKYAEGTAGHRFYAGCQNVDTVETIASLADVDRPGRHAPGDAFGLAKEDEGEKNRQERRYLDKRNHPENLPRPKGARVEKISNRPHNPSQHERPPGSLHPSQNLFALK